MNNAPDKPWESYPRFLDKGVNRLQGSGRYVKCNYFLTYKINEITIMVFHLFDFCCGPNCAIFVLGQIQFIGRLAHVTGCSWLLLFIFVVFLCENSSRLV